MSTGTVGAGREMDALVAERVMLWRPVPSAMVKGRTDWLRPNRDYPSTLPEFSTKVAATREMEEALKARGLEREYVWQLLKLSNGFSSQRFPSNINELVNLIYASLVVRCRAALVAIEEK
jgi:hypothetical protein